MNLAGNYIHSKTFKLLMDCKVSEPPPSNAYALPKDYKEGLLKGRPIISTTYNIVRPFAQLFSNLLMPLIKDNVKSYTQLMSDFISEIKQVMFNINLDHLMLIIYMAVYF